MREYHGIQKCWYTPVYTRADFKLSYYADGQGCPQRSTFAGNTYCKFLWKFPYTFKN